MCRDLGHDTASQAHDTALATRPPSLRHGARGGHDTATRARPGRDLCAQAGLWVHTMHLASFLLSTVSESLFEHCSQRFFEKIYI